MNITFIEAVKRFYSNYANFNGRATRAEYWYSVLYLIVAYAIMRNYSADTLRR